MGNISKNKITFFNILSTVILSGLSFFTVPIFSRMLGAENYGITSIYSTYVSFVAAVFSLQCGGALIHAKRKYHDDEKVYQSSIMLLILVLFAIFSALTLLICFTLKKNGFNINFILVILCLIQSLGTYSASYINTKFTYDFKAQYNFCISLSVAIMNISFSYILIRMFNSDINYYGRIAGSALSYLVTLLLIVAYFVKQERMTVNVDYWIFTLKITFPLVFHLISTLILGNSDRIMIQNMIGNASVGVYSLSYSFSSIVSIISIALNNSWTPFCFRYMELNDTEALRLHGKNFIDLYSIIVAVFLLLSREVFKFLVSEPFFLGIDLIPLFVCETVSVFWYMFPSSFEFYYGKTRAIAISTIIVAILNIILNYIFVTKWSYFGVAIATLLSQFFRFVFHYVYASKMNVGNFVFRNVFYVKSLLIVSFSCLLFYSLEEKWFLRWGLGFILTFYLMLKIYRRRSIF